MSKEKGKAYGHRSNESNYFPTPYSMTTQLFEKEFFNPEGTILEPACGKCHMAFVLNEIFENLDIYDIDSEEFYGDFYKENRKFDYIISNPPYGKDADRFVIKAKQVVQHKFAFLLRTNFLSGQSRLESGIYDGLKNIYIFSRMPDLRFEPRADGKYPTAMNVYAWMVWESGYKGNPMTDWIDNQKFVLKASEK